jgi:hypothetical protein
METNVLMEFNHKLESKLKIIEQEMTDSIMRLREANQDLEDNLAHRENESHKLQLNNTSL